MASDITKSSFNVVTVTLIGGLVALLGLQLYTASQLSSTSAEIAALTEKQQTEQQQLQDEIRRLQMEADRNNQQQSEQQDSLSKLRETADQTQQRVQGLSSDMQQKSAAVQDLYENLGTTQADLQDRTKQFQNEIAAVKQSTSQAHEGLDRISTQVDQLRDTTASKKDLEAAVANLNRVTGDLGVVSDRIATNEDELNALRKLAERDYLDFEIYALNSPIMVADGISITLKSADPASQRYSLELEVDGRKIEKDNREVNEPLQFLVGRDRTPWELVVNNVGVGMISGYLARPLVTGDDAAQ